RDHTSALSRKPEPTETNGAGQNLRVSDQHAGHEQRVSEGTPHSRRRDQQPFSAVRSQSEYGATVRDQCRGKGRDADDSSRQRVSVAYAAAGYTVAASTRAAHGDAPLRKNVAQRHALRCSLPAAEPWTPVRATRLSRPLPTRWARP